MTDHKSSGQSRVRYNGETFYLGPIGSAESRRRYVELLTKLSPPDAAKKAAWPTVGEVAYRWLAERGPGHTGKEAANYAAALEALRGAGRDRLPADQFTVAHLGEVRKLMVALGWCRNVINRQVVRVRTVWRWAEEAGLAPPGSWHHLQSLRPLAKHDRSVRHTEPVRPAAWGQVQAVLARLRSRPVRAMLLLQWWTGMRAGEVRRMLAGEVDRSGEVWIYRPGSHKNAWRGQSRVVPLGPQAQAVLAPFLEGVMASDGRVFRTRKGGIFTDSAYGSMVGRAARKAGLGWFRPLCCRHSARRRFTAEVGLEATRELMGHADVRTSLHYGAGQDVGIAVEAARKAG